MYIFLYINIYSTAIVSSNLFKIPLNKFTFTNTRHAISLYYAITSTAPAIVVVIFVLIGFQLKRWHTTAREESIAQPKWQKWTSSCGLHSFFNCKKE